MNRIDGVILGVGIVVLAASIVGVLLYDDTAGPEFDVTFQESDTDELEPLADNVNPGEHEFEVPLEVDGGMANAVFTVDVSTGTVRLSDDTVEVALTGPDGQTGDCSFTMAAGAGGSGSCQAVATVQAQPDQVTLNAENATEAEQTASEQALNLTAGNGPWIATVTITGGTAPQGASYTVEVTPGYTTWAPTATTPGPGGISGP